MDGPARALEEVPPPRFSNKHRRGMSNRLITNHAARTSNVWWLPTRIPDHANFIPGPTQRFELTISGSRLTCQRHLLKSDIRVATLPTPRACWLNLRIGTRS